MDFPIPKGTTPDQKLAWFPHDDGTDHPSAWVRCPNGHTGILAYPTHNIASDGRVSPSLICPARDDGCDFHQTVQLIGWPG